MNNRLRFRAYFENRYIYKSLTEECYYTEDNKAIGFANTLPNTLDWEQCTGLRDKNGKLIYEGDNVVSLYVDPIGRIHEDTFDENKYAIKYMNGCYGIESKTQFIPLQNFLRQTEGEYISNAGNKIIYGSCILKVVGNINETTEFLENNPEFVDE